jgi:hypothetical protein
MERRVFVSATSDQSLDERRRQLKAAIIRKIQDAGYSPQEFWEMGIAEDLAWNFDNVDHVMRQCVGAIVIGFPRWIMSGENYTIRLVGEYHHYEGAIAIALGLPLLIIAEEGVESRGIVWSGGGRTITHLPGDANPNWVDGPEFTRRFTAWLGALAARRDVFLGYCGKSKGIAAQIQLLLQKHGATVRNWAMDFRPGVSILNEIEAARAACSCGIFLFSEDDPLQDVPGGAAPRDNVVFEAGYFISSKGASRCLIIREGDAKMPADLGGSIYVSLKKDEDIATIEGRLVQFLEMNL